MLFDDSRDVDGSAVAALNLLAERGAERMRMVSLVAAPEGILGLVKKIFK